VEKIPEKRCYFCNVGETELSGEQLQVHSSRECTFRCKKCASSRVYFYGSGDFPDIIKLTEEDRWKFFQSIKHANKQAKLEMVRSLKTTNVNDKIHETGYKGRFIPEGVLKVQGYDVERIKATTPQEDIKEDKQLGTCYRINIQKVDFTHTQGTKNSDEYEGTDRPSSSRQDGGARLSEMMNMLKRDSKEHMAKRTKRRVMVDKEILVLNKMKMDIRLNKVPKEMNPNASIEKMVGDLEALDLDSDQFDQKLADFKQVSTPLMKALKMFT